MKAFFKLIPLLVVLFLVQTSVVKADVIDDLTPAWRVVADHLATVAGGSKVNGDSITQWKDVVGTLHLNTAAARGNPTYKTNVGAFLDHSAVYFTPAGVGANADALGTTTPTGVYNGTAQTMVVVFARTANSGTVLGFTGSNDWLNRRTVGMTTYLQGEKGAGDRLLVGDSAGSSAVWAQSASSLPTYTTGDLQSQVWGLLTVDGSGSPTDRLYLNTNDYSGFTQVATLNYNGPPTPSFLWVGSTYHGSAAGFSGFLAEAIVWNRVLTPDEIQSVANYLKSTYMPEPAGLAMLGLGMLGVLRRKRA